MTIVLLISAVLLIFTVAIDIVGTVTNEWILYTASGQSAIEGVWRICTSGVCTLISDSETINAIQAMMVLGIIFGGIALIIAIIEYGYSAFKDKYSVVVVILILGLVIGADLFTIVGVIVYQADFKKNRENTLTGIDVKDGYSYWLAIVSIGFYTITILVLVAAAFLHSRQKTLVEARKEDLQRMFIAEREIRERPRRSPSRLARPVRPSYAEKPKRSRSESRRRGSYDESRDWSKRHKRSRSVDYGDYQYFDYYGFPLYYRSAGFAMVPEAYSGRAYALTTAAQPKSYYALTPAASSVPITAVPYDPYSQKGEYVWLQ